MTFNNSFVYVPCLFILFTSNCRKIKIIMSILLVRSLHKLCQNNQINKILKLTSQSLNISSSYKLQKEKIKNTSITPSNASDRTDISTDVRPLGERIKENTKTVSYFGVIVFGIGVTGVIMFIVFRELFSSTSPNNVYSDALKMCVNVSSIVLLNSIRKQ